MVDFIADYLENIRSRRVFPDVSPGYMSTLVPDSAPQDPEPWEKIFRDVETVIMPGVSDDWGQNSEWAQFQYFSYGRDSWRAKKDRYYIE